MASDGGSEGRKSWKKAVETGFTWISPSPSPEVVAALEGRFPDIVQVPTTALELESECWQESAILARTFNRWVPSDAIIRELRRAGVSGDIVPVSLAYHCHILRFADATAREMVLGKPWVINGQPLAMEEWRPEFIPSPDCVASALLWVRLPKLPMEFWADEILRSILAPAGEFVFSDASTQLKNRGGYARACLRVDLRRALRPGVRVRGFHSPFWQQFVYEQLEGICSDCGSLHLKGPCTSSSQKGPGESSSGAIFGPWMLAVRQRKSPSPELKKMSHAGPGLVSAQGSRPPSSAAVPGGSSSPDGWIPAGKVARRNRGKTPSHLAVADDGRASGDDCLESSSGEPRVVPSDEGRAGFQSTVTNNGSDTLSEASATYLNSNSKLNLKPKLQLSNPFALLGTDDSLGRPLILRDANPGPSKRARPVETQAPRTAAKLNKRKGKAVAKVSPTLDRPVEVQAGNCDTNRAMILPSKPVDKSHDLLISCLKKAIQGKICTPMISIEASRAVEMDTRDEGSDMACTTQISEGGTQTSGGPLVSAMMEDQAVIHLSPSSQ